MLSADGGWSLIRGNFQRQLPQGVIVGTIELLK